MQRSYLIALIIALVAAGWLLSPYALELIRPAVNPASAPATSPASDAGEVAAGNPPAADADESDGAAKPLLRVSVRHSVAETRVKALILTGQTEPSRQANLKAETSGQIVSVEAAEGAAIKTGDVIAKLAMGDRESRLAEAKALLDQRRIEYEAARKLTSKGFQTQVRLAESKAQMGAAQSLLRRIELDIERTVIRAPFDGVLQDRVVEVGDYLGTGDPVAMIVDLNPVLAVGQLSEREWASVRRNAQGRARLVTGETVDGRVRYISAVGAAGTRTFRVELELQNPDGRIAAGLTAEMTLPVTSVEAHVMSPAALTLDDAGVVGVITVDAENTVHFNPVELVDGGADGVWVAGLPREATIITVGQEFVLPGQKVIPVPEDEPGVPTRAETGGQS